MSAAAIPRGDTPPPGGTSPVPPGPYPPEDARWNGKDTGHPVAGPAAKAQARAVRLINDIAVQFPHLPAGEAAARTAAHVQRFWEARMLADLRAATSQPDNGMTDRAAAAAKLLAAQG